MHLLLVRPGTTQLPFSSRYRLITTGLRGGGRQERGEDGGMEDTWNKDTQPRVKDLEI